MIIILLIFLLISSPVFASGWYSTLQGTASDVEQDIPSDGVILQWSSFYQKWLFTYGVTPSGGTTGQVLTKNSNSNYDYSWQPAGTASNITGLITAGTNITLSGNGTAGTPYVINSSGGGGSGLWETNSVGIDTFSPAVGIGSTNPGQTLDVQGTVRSTGFLAGSGIPSLPSYSFSASPNTGMYFGSSAIQFESGGSAAATLNSSGVSAQGFGLTFVSTPSSGVITLGQTGLLDWGATSSSNDTGISRLRAKVLALGNATANNATGTLVLQNIGIGTTAPTGVLEVEGGNVGIGTWIVPDGGSNNTILWGNVGIRTSKVGGAGEGALTVMNGNVGIGTWVPGQALDVVGTVRAQAFTATKSSSLSTIAGNVAIGTTAASYNLDVYGSFSVLNHLVYFTTPYNNTFMTFYPQNTDQAAGFLLNDDVNQWFFSSNGSSNTSGSGIFVLGDTGSYGNPQSTPLEIISQNASCAPSGLDLTIIGASGNAGCYDELDNTSALQVAGTENIGEGLIVNSLNFGINPSFEVLDDNSSIDLQVNGLTGAVKTLNSTLDDGFTGNAIIHGSMTAASVIKSGGTSSQFLKANGTVDSNTYLTTSSASSSYVPFTGAASNLDLNNKVLSDVAGITINNNTNLYIKDNAGTARSFATIDPYNDFYLCQNCSSYLIIQPNSQKVGFGSLPSGPVSGISVEGNMNVGAGSSNNTAAPTNGIYSAGDIAIGASVSSGLLNLTGTAGSDYIYFDDTTANQNCYMGLTTPIGSGPDLTIGQNCNRVIIGDSPTGSSGTYALRVATQTVEWQNGIDWSGGAKDNYINGNNSFYLQSNVNNTKWFQADRSTGTQIQGYNTTGSTYLPVIIQPLGGGVTINGTTAVSCAAGTVNLSTEVITNGIVTHC